MKPFLLTLSLLLSAQTTPTFLETLEVQVTNLDVVVTDRAGHPVTGLARDDFEVRENGALQPITNFAEYRAADPAQAPPPRKFVFFVDEMSVNMRTRAQLVDRAAALVRGAMRPGDEAMIVTPAKGEKIALTFTGDRAAVEKQLRRTLDAESKFRVNTASRLEQFQFQSLARNAMSRGEYEQVARLYATRVNRRVTSTLRTLLGIVGSLSETSGRKVIIVFSESLVSQPGYEAFSLGARNDAIVQPVPLVDAISPDDPNSADLKAAMPGRTSFYDVRPMIHELTARAGANGITIYSLQPETGLQISVSDDNSGRWTISQFQRDIVDGTADTLRTLADGTGGRFVVGDVPKSFRDMENDLGAYYSIGYRDGGGTGSVRAIDVRVKGRPELTVRTRHELLRRTPEKEMDEMVAANLITPRAVNELAIAATAGVPKRNANRTYRIDVAVRIPLAKLTFIPEGNMYRARFSVHYAAADGGDYTTGQYREQILQAAPADIDTVRTKTYTYTTTLVVAPGTANISVGVLDAYSRLSGFERLHVVAR